jgi:hypothetical protein
MSSIPGRSFFGRGQGGGRGWRTGWRRARWNRPLFQPASAGSSREQDLTALKGQAEYLEETLDVIRKRIEELLSRSAAE